MEIRKANRKNRLGITIRLPIDLHVWIKNYAEKERQPVNLAIVLLIQKKYNNDKKKRTGKELYQSVKNEINAHRPRPKIKRSMTIRLPVDLHEWIKDYAEKIDVSINTAIIYLIKKKCYSEKQKNRKTNERSAGKDD